jgi:hypothetical protein
MRNAVVIKTHFLNEYLVAYYERLKQECSLGFEIFIALNCEDFSAHGDKYNTLIESGVISLCNNNILLRFPYPEKCRREHWKLNPGNTDLIMLHFISEHPDYDYYWGIEYDVHYEGKWSFLMDAFSKSSADLLTTTIYRHMKTPGRNLATPPFISPTNRVYRSEALIKSFLPIYRLSKRGAQEIHNAYCDGCGGHYEITWPTILYNSGFVLEDIGGNGPWVQPENLNRFYFNTPRTPSLSPGTFVFRWAFKAVPHQANILWHPVKPSGAFRWYSEADRSFARWVTVSAKRLISWFVIRAWLLTRWRNLKD